MINHYYEPYFDKVHRNFLTPPYVPTSQKKNRVAYINRHCDTTLNGRNDIVKELSKHFPVTAYGCLGSKEWANKTQVFSESKVRGSCRPPLSILVVIIPFRFVHFLLIVLSCCTWCPRSSA